MTKEPEDAKRKVIENDPRLNDVESNWLQLTSYDIDKVYSKKARPPEQDNIISKPLNDRGNTDNLYLSDPPSETSAG